MCLPSQLYLVAFALYGLLQITHDEVTAFVQALDAIKKAGYPKDGAKRLEKEVSSLEQNLQICFLWLLVSPIINTRLSDLLD